MNTIGIIISILLIIFGIWLNNIKGNPFDITFTSLGAVIFVLSIISIEEQNIPTAKDVYRGNTTLKITYIDSVAVDSVVVFKNKE